MIKDRRVWILGMAYFFTVIGLTGLGFWMPQFIKRFDYSDTVVGMLGTIPYIAGAVVMCWWSNHSDKTGERTWHFIIPSLVFSVGFVIAAISDSPVISMLGLNDIDDRNAVVRSERFIPFPPHSLPAGAVPVAWH
ncbi:4-hydroxyphenylacetate permease [Leclercia adecarboxylata]|uniref:4-hydroxyphenylacetate permease n=1 Tax=Leclercia adecarboxylata TaxID=83655 RepID=A0A4U9HRP9_9ENTR|nr:4-hydroxyphenylacetate permease [Leclercia adecarboxylata]